MNKAHFALKLRTDRKNIDGSCSIFLYANVNGKVKYFTTNCTAFEDQWNLNKQEVYAKASNWVHTNAIIKNFRSCAEEFVRKANLSNKRIEATDLEHLLRASSFISNSYFDFIEAYIKENQHSFKKKTIDNYRSHKSVLMSFRPELTLHSINRTFWKDFEQFARSKNYSQNTIHKYFKTLNKFANSAVKMGLIEENLLKGIKVKEVPGDRDYLSKDELNKLEKAYKDGNLIIPGHKEVLRCFLFACFTGLRYSDIKSLKHKHIFSRNNPNEVEIRKQIYKTNNTEVIPLNLKAFELLSAYTLPEAFVFKVYSNQYMNRKLQQIADLIGIKKHLTSHVARHTAGTLLYDLSGDIEAVRKILGHKKIQTTEIYAKLLDKKKRSVLNLMNTI